MRHFIAASQPDSKQPQIHFKYQNMRNISHTLQFAIEKYFCKINVQQLLEITYIISHNSCSEGATKFVWPPLQMLKLPLQDDTKLESILKWVMLVLLQETAVIGNLHNTKCIGKFHELLVRNKQCHCANSMEITNIVWTESDRAVHEELNDTKFIIV